VCDRVRRRELAQVHVLVRREDQTGGGRSFLLRGSPEVIDGAARVELHHAVEAWMNSWYAAKVGGWPVALAHKLKRESNSVASAAITRCRTASTAGERLRDRPRHRVERA